jgi:hypothetical protein
VINDRAFIMTGNECPNEMVVGGDKAEVLSGSMQYATATMDGIEQRFSWPPLQLTTQPGSYILCWCSHWKHLKAAGEINSCDSWYNYHVRARQVILEGKLIHAVISFYYSTLLYRSTLNLPCLLRTGPSLKTAPASCTAGLPCQVVVTGTGLTNSNRGHIFSARCPDVTSNGTVLTTTFTKMVYSASRAEYSFTFLPAISYPAVASATTGAYAVCWCSGGTAGVCPSPASYIVPVQKITMYGT